MNKTDLMGEKKADKSPKTNYSCIFLILNFASLFLRFTPV